MDKKVAFVTGGSRGIGRAIVRRLVSEGYAVAINYAHNEQAAVSLLEDVRGNGFTANIYQGDVANAADVERMAAEVTAQLGEVSLLVNNAGIAQQKLFTDITPEEWHRMMAVHVDGAYHTCRVFLPTMLRRHEGCIINIASMWGQVGGSCEVHYSTAKAALIGMTKALAKEVGPSGIRVNCVAPGVIDTDMMADFSEEDRRHLAEETPLCRLGAPDDVAATVAFLASPAADFITGQVIAPNGGIVI